MSGYGTATPGTLALYTKTLEGAYYPQCSIKVHPHTGLWHPSSGHNLAHGQKQAGIEEP